jgi:broad specificity phosphatase PhoE
MELWLVRHGESEYSATKRVAGWSDPPLTAVGRAQAEALRSHFDGRQFAGVWSSDLVRTIESARLAYGEPTPDRRLRECHFGDLEGCTYEEADGAYREVFQRFNGFEVPGGESHLTFRQRVVGFIDQLEPGCHALFVHGGVIRVLTQDLGLDRFVPTGTVVGLDWTRRELLFVHEPGNTSAAS